MKKFVKVTIIIICLLVLFLPHKSIYRDGGTTTYSALTYKIIIWHRISPEKTYEDTDFYIFPFNFHKLIGIGVIRLKMMLEKQI